jgi:hypothetical protein
MKRLTIAAMTAGLLLLPSRARADLNEGLLTLTGGQSDCQAKRYASGVKKILDAAVTIQQADPKHAANQRWLPAVQACFGSWLQDAASRCQKEGAVSALEELRQIEQQVKYVAAPVVKKALPGKVAACIGQIAKLGVKECETSPGPKALERLDQLKEQIGKLGADGKALAPMEAGQRSCALKWAVEAESRCQTTASVEALQEIGTAVPRVGTVQKARAQQAYESCAKALGQRGYATCQNRRYGEGRALLKNAIERWSFFGKGDQRFLAKMKQEWLPLCGSYFLGGYFNGTVVEGATSFTLSAKVSLEVGRTGKTNTLVGELRSAYSAVGGTRKGCRVLITPTDGRYSLTGSENPASKQLTIMIEANMPQSESYEDVQVTCGEEAPKLAKARYLHQLLKAAGVLSVGLSTTAGAQRSYQWRGVMDGGAKGQIAGTLTLGIAE